MSHPPASTTPPGRRRSPFIWIAIVLAALALWFGTMFFGNRAEQKAEEPAPAAATAPAPATSP